MTLATLPSRLDTTAAHPLRAALLRTIDQGLPITLDGGEVREIGLACLQILFAARATAAERELGFAVCNPSPSLRKMATLAGLDEVWNVPIIGAEFP
ncbi:STAS domain-containing protein [Sphingomonas sp. PP-CC-3G-468]|uniref:STAS domain-containing protein n=1 Tax=Sphingomonas sp. PP-CC-3G-468 TaxID=2135656 RepID=UPI0010500E08|nr:STAS domain-containing protein [Sphingomonas sp. PP-CC-3G-468]